MPRKIQRRQRRTFRLKRKWSRVRRQYVINKIPARGWKHNMGVRPRLKAGRILSTRPRAFAVGRVMRKYNVPSDVSRIIYKKAGFR